MADLISLSELPREIDARMDSIPEPRMVWALELPASLDQDRIAIDHGHLRRLQSIAGFALNAVTSFDGKTDEYDAQISGINFGGEATMGAVKKVRKADPSQERAMSEFSDPRIKELYGKYAAVSVLNKPAMVDNVVRLRQKDMTAEEAWARTLDDHLNRSMRSAANHILVERHGLQRAFQSLDYIALGALATTSAIDIAVADMPDVFLPTVFAVSRVMNVLSDSFYNKMKEGNTYLNKRRWSIFTSSQPDRYLAFSALTRMNTLVKVKK